MFTGAPDARRIANRALAATSSVEEVRQLPRLPGTRAEIEELARELGAERGDILLGARASEPNLWAARERLARARVVAFATHGLIAGEFGLQEPALALTPPQDARAPSDEGYVDDGLLTASEVMSLSLTAEWVILSACNTAAAGAQSAEGMSGLARAFFYAGAEALLVSHWRMRDDVAMRLSTRAVALSQGSGRTRAQALRAAMSEVMRDPRDDSAGHSLSHPGAWAAFQFVGAPS